MRDRCTLLISLLVLAVSLLLIRPALAQDDWEDDGNLPVEVHGFADGAFGGRLADNSAQADDIVLGEARFRLDLAHYTDRAELYFKGDFLTDDVVHRTHIDIRQAAILLRAHERLDLRVGRQVLTWGTGDLLFVNDLFPKDFVSFFIGRDNEFLKAPSNSLKATFYSGIVNADIAWTPVFAPDKFITGERLSFFDRSIGGLTSAAQMGGPLTVRKPDRIWENGEFAGRLFRKISGYEVAAYGYVGFSKQPVAFDQTVAIPTFSRLAVWGASARGNLLGGIANVEGAFYDSYKDRDGGNPNLPNSHIRGLLGYERELVANFTTGVQYYVERIHKHEELVASSPSAEFEPKETRHLFTIRLNQRLRQETVTLSLFAFFSPNDEDGYARPAVSHKWSDSVTMTLGANVMWGDEYTFFGQLQDNTNVYARLRYSF
ncbi:MAG: hypothetical protein OEN01_10215 [Candidatus Krumholzibacteria bacterium]|nr:hypothetical protein [Candidatus Krumholzibacteria bacterium]